MNNLKFSVIMSVYKNDNPIFFDRSLESITASQTLLPNEIVIVVDGPIGDQLNKVLVKYTLLYDFFKIIRLEINGGLGNALKIAIEYASHELIARMDSDDISLPSRFEQQINFFRENNNIDIIGGDITEFIDIEENIISKRAVPKLNNDIKEYIKKRCPFNHVSVMYKKSAVIKAGGYKDLFWNEDYYLWIRMMESSANMGNTGTVLVNVRVGKDMYKRRGGKKYFISEKYLQKYMLDNKIINKVTYLENIFKRFIIQIILPSNLRGFVFKKFARKAGY